MSNDKQVKEAQKMCTDNTAQYSGLTPFKPGQSGNPKGRPKGSRNKLSEDFLKDFSDTWEKFGTQALEYMAKHEPVKLVQAAVQILPKDFQLTVDADQVQWVISAGPVLSPEDWFEWVKADNAKLEAEKADKQLAIISEDKKLESVS